MWKKFVVLLVLVCFIRINEILVIISGKLDICKLLDIDFSFDIESDYVVFLNEIESELCKIWVKIFDFF